MTFSVIMPVHNDAAMLRLTLNSVYALRPDEVLFALDRCTDFSEEMIKRARRWHGHTRTRILPYGEGDGRGWKFRSAYLRRELYRLAENDTIINTSADLNLDPRIREIVDRIPDPFALISLGYLDRWTLGTFITRLKQKALRGGFGGLLAVSRDAWMRTEDLDELKRVSQGEDDHLFKAIKTRYRARNVTTCSLHLRPNTHPLDQYLCGVDEWKYNRTPLRRAVRVAAMSLRPALLVGYRHARCAEENGWDLDDFAEAVVKVKRSRLNE